MIVCFLENPAQCFRSRDLSLSLYFQLQGCLKFYAFYSFFFKKKERINNMAAGYIVDGNERANESVLNVCATGIYSCTYLECIHDVMLQCRITNYDSVGGGGGGDASDYDGCGGDAVIIIGGWLPDAAYARQQPTTIQNKTSAHALDVNRIVKSMAVVIARATTDRIQYNTYIQRGTCRYIYTLT